MASCNNCSLKEKEQVYTSARDGNLMYLKVSMRKYPPKKICDRFRTVKHRCQSLPIICKKNLKFLSTKPWIFFFRFCLFWFDFRRLYFIPPPSRTDSIKKPVLISRSSARSQPSMPKYPSRPDTSREKVELRCELCVFFYYQRRRLSLFYSSISLYAIFEGFFVSASISIFIFTPRKTCWKKKKVRRMFIYENW